MGRKKLIRSGIFPYHITARVNNRDWFYVPLGEVWKIFERELLRASLELNAQVVSFVLMSNHYHLFMFAPDQNIDRIMRSIQRNVSVAVGTISGRSNHVFGSRYHWSLVQTDLYARHVYRYVYQNPVAAGLVKRVEDYPYGTLQTVLGRTSVKFPLFDPDRRCFAYVPKNLDDRVGWLNRTYSPEQWAIIEHGLKRKIFALTKDKNYAKVVRSLEEEFLGKHQVPFKELGF